MVNFLKKKATTFKHKATKIHTLTKHKKLKKKHTQ